jgi:hypothetical protein
MAKQMTDVGLDINEDLGVDNGDFTAAESTAQHQRQLIMNNNGDFKQNPIICTGVYNFLNDENFQDLMRKIGLEFIRDGMEVKNVALTQNGIITSDAYYP